MQKDITSLQLRLVATVRRSRAAAAVVVNLCSLWMSSEALLETAGGCLPSLLPFKIFCTIWAVKIFILFTIY
mgnify:CR=1 FL=1